MSGHLFIINGDLRRIACDDLLLPTDSEFRIEPKWDALICGHYEEIDTYKSSPAASWKGSLVLPLTPQDHKPRVWLGDVGVHGDAADFSQFEPVIKEFVEQAGKRKLSDRSGIYKWPLRRLAVNVVGSGAGGGRGKKGELAKGLVGILTRLAHEHEVDIILVTFGSKPYAAAQWARRDLLRESSTADAWPLRPALHRKAEELANDAIDRQLVLFIGAGVSAGAGVDTWADLLEKLAKDDANYNDAELERLKKMDLRDQATLIESALHETSDSFKKRVAERIQQSHHYSLAHGLLASLPSQEAVTTNFDQLYEVAAGNIAVLPKDPRESGGRLLLKLHGSVDNYKDMILTRSDYLKMPRQYGALMGLVQGLLMMRKMVFVGYSLSDEDFHELLEEVRAARGENTSGVGRGTVLTLQDDALVRKLWQQDLDTVPVVTEGEFTNDLPRAARQLELFLDLVGFHATTSAGFFLDESYAGLAASEHELLEPLQELVALTAKAEPHSVGSQVRRFLDSLGADYRDAPGQ